MLIQKIRLQILILQIQLQIKLLGQKRTVPNLPKPKAIIIHHGGGNWGFWQVNGHHKNLWGFKSSLGYYIGYHKWIAYNGKLYLARRDNEKGAHLADPKRPYYWNKSSIGICLQGNFEIEQPTESQLITLKRELDKYDVSIKMHRDIEATLCPGNNLAEWVNEYRKGRH